MKKKILLDQRGNSIEIIDIPKKVISIVPSQTELICDLGAVKHLVGKTKFCIHPKNVLKNIPNVGGTKTLDLEIIHKLNPDLIIAGFEENEKAQILELSKNFNVWTSDIKNFEDAMQMILCLGEIIGKTRNSQKLVKSINLRFKKIKPVNYSVAYIIWQNPLMTVGGDTFINEMLLKAGFHNVFGLANRYPVISEVELKKKAPEILMLASEPFPFKDKHIGYFKEICPDSKIILVNGEMFSWYGSRMLMMPEYFNNLSKILQLKFKPWAANDLE
jgi:ABC-type Fe3+-hydroxamate transport system substrate-binding protein